MGQLGGNLGELGAKAGQLGPTWGQSGRPWGQLRLIWDQLRTNLLPTLAWHPASEPGVDAFSRFSIELEFISVVANPKEEIERSLSESGVDAFSAFSIELELISVVANPKGGNRALSIRIQGRCIFHVFD